jgi:shikimate kinase
MEENEEIRELLRKYKIPYRELLEFIPNFKTANRVSDELSRPLNDKRKEIYMIAIKKILEKRKKFYNESLILGGNGNGTDSTKLL